MRDTPFLQKRKARHSMHRMAQMVGNEPFGKNGRAKAKQICGRKGFAFARLKILKFGGIWVSAPHSSRTQYERNYWGLGRNPPLASLFSFGEIRSGHMLTIVCRTKISKFIYYS